MCYWSIKRNIFHIEGFIGHSRTPVYPAIHTLPALWRSRIHGMAYLACRLSRGLCGVYDIEFHGQVSRVFFPQRATTNTHGVFACVSSLTMACESGLTVDAWTLGWPCTGHWMTIHAMSICGKYDPCFTHSALKPHIVIANLMAVTQP